MVQEYNEVMQLAVQKILEREIEDVVKEATQEKQEEINRQKLQIQILTEELKQNTEPSIFELINTSNQLALALDEKTFLLKKLKEMFERILVVVHPDKGNEYSATCALCGATIKVENPTEPISNFPHEQDCEAVIFLKKIDE